MVREGLAKRDAASKHHPVSLSIELNTSRSPNQDSFGNFYTYSPSLNLLLAEPRHFSERYHVVKLKKKKTLKPKIFQSHFKLKVINSGTHLIIYLIFLAAWDCVASWQTWCRAFQSVFVCCQATVSGSNVDQ